MSTQISLQSWKHFGIWRHENIMLNDASINSKLIRNRDCKNSKRFPSFHIIEPVFTTKFFCGPAIGRTFFRDPTRLDVRYTPNLRYKSLTRDPWYTIWWIVPFVLSVFINHLKSLITLTLELSTFVIFLIIWICILSVQSLFCNRNIRMEIIFAIFHCQKLNTKSCMEFSTFSAWFFWNVHYWNQKHSPSVVLIW